MNKRMLMAAAAGVVIILAGLLLSNIDVAVVRWFAFVVLEVPLLLIALPLDSVEMPQWLTVALWAATAFLLWSGVAFIVLSLLRVSRGPSGSLRAGRRPVEQARPVGRQKVD